MKRLLAIILFVLPIGLHSETKAQKHCCGNSPAAKWSFNAGIGATMVHGLDMKNADAPPGTNISPEIGAGVSFAIRPWLRLGLNYGFSKYAREQRFSEFQPLKKNAAEETPSEQYGGLAYSRMWTRYHAADIVLEYNLLELWKNRGDRRFGLYAGSGFGWLFAKGNTYDISVGHERLSETYGETINTWLNAENKHHKYNAGYIPIRLSAEFDASPTVTVGIQGNYKRIVGCGKAPKGIGTLSAVFRYNLAGSKSCNKSKSKRLCKSPENPCKR